MTNSPTSNEREDWQRAPERIYMHPTSAEANVNPWPLEPGEYVEYVRADLLDSQAADYTRPAGWRDAVQRADPRKVHVTFESREQAEAFIRGLQPAVGPMEAANAMRDKCIEKVKAWYASGQRTVPHSLITALESLTLDQVEQKQ